MARDTTSINPACHIALELEGATEDDLQRGVAAAIAVFEAARVDPWTAAAATDELEWATPAPDDVPDGRARLFVIYNQAIEAALKAACEYLPNTPKKYNFSLFWNGDAPRTPNPDALEVVYPTTVYGRPPEEVIPRLAGRHRKLVGWSWEWEYLK